MSNIEITPYKDLYKDQIIRLILKIQTEEFNIPVSRHDQPDLEQIDTFYQTGTGNFWVALDGSKVIGTIALIDIGHAQTALRKMFVDHGYRGKDIGIAQALLDTLIKWCENNSVKEIYLGTIDVFLAAHRFYEKNGFQEISKLTLPQAFPIMPLDTKFYRLIV